MAQLSLARSCYMRCRKVSLPSGRLEEEGLAYVVAEDSFVLGAGTALLSPRDGRQARPGTHSRVKGFWEDQER